MEISIVLPVFNEQDNVLPLIEEIDKACRRFLENYEIIFVDDASSDNTVDNIRSYQDNIPSLRLMRHKHNYGQSASILTGVRAATFPWIVTLDGDGQNDPNDIQNLVNKLQANPSNIDNVMVMGRRQKRHDSFIRKLSSRIANSIRSKMLHDNCPDTGCSLKLFPKQAFLQVPHFDHLHRFLPVLFQRAGMPIIHIPVNHRPRLRGQSKYGIRNRLWVGIIDLFGVRWLQRRPCNPELSHENF